MGDKGGDDTVPRERARLRLRPGTWPFRAVAAVVVAVTVTALIAASLSGHVLGDVRRQLQDRFYPTGPTDERVLVVEITADDVEQRGGWPWPRGLHAQLVSRLTEADAAAIAYDVVFSEVVDSEGRPVAASSGDQAFAQAIADAGNVVLAMTGRLDATQHPDRLVLVDPRRPSAPLAEAAVGLAHANVLGDPSDGVIRGVPVVVEVGRTFVPSLAAAAVAVAEGADVDQVILRPFGVQLGTEVYPARPEDRRVFDLNWSSALAPGASDRPAVSAGDVLDGRVSRDAIAGRIVLIGVTDPLEGDIVATPVAKVDGAPGIDVHANAVNTILTGLTREPIDDRSTLLFAAGLAMLVALLALWWPLWSAPLLLAATVAVYLGWADLRFQRAGSVDLLWPNVAVLLAVVGAVVIRYLTEVREKRRVAALFGQYVPPAVADELVASGRLQAATEGERVDVTVFFCDLRGFTKAAAGLEPGQVRRMLNAYYEHVTSLILAHEGTVMQYVGDEVFAIFGAPVRQPDHPQRAVDCAVEVRDSIDDLNARLAEEGLPSVAFGIGLNTGPVVAAHVGTFHKQYAVIGDTVNVGSRFCSLAKEHQIALPGELRALLSREPALLEVGPVAMKGVERDLQVYKVGRTSDRTPEAAYAANLDVTDEAPKAVELGPG